MGEAYNSIEQAQNFLDRAKIIVQYYEENPERARFNENYLRSWFRKLNSPEIMVLSLSPIFAEVNSGLAEVNSGLIRILQKISTQKEREILQKQDRK